MLRSVLTRPARIVQHTALGVVHTGLNTVASVISAVRGGGDGDSSPVPAPNPAPPRRTPVAKDVELASDAAEKAPPVKKTPAAKKAPAAKRAPAKKAPAKKSAPSSVPTPADVAERVARLADEPEHVDSEEVLAYSTGPDVSTTVADEVAGSAKS